MPTPRPPRHGRLAALTSLVLVLALLGGCGTSADPVADDPRPLALATFTVVADIARNVAGDDLRVASITKVGAEIHGYDPTPGDLRRAAGADIILDNGLGLEAWFARFVDGLDVPRVTLSEGLATIPVARGEAEGRPNPHAWMSPSAGAAYARRAAEAFAALDPAHADGYRGRAEAYATRLQTLRDELVTRLETVPEASRALVTCEGAFSYLTADVGLEERYLWAVNAEQQATPQQVADVETFVRERSVPAVFCESTVNPSAMQRLAEATGARYVGPLYVDSLSAPDGPVPTYLDLLRHDVELIVSGLTGGAA
ncbi:metal ABC transporter solute-binding protein, Zn/Mn family [Sanguibacter sp. HDW7]|uniref:metal ABC transporter solute-binding protein, Zn/Mn family n=1 Tax=Sanguibacter sp. HDW7 TaxID=2714931 RepID=UPI00140B9D90|nr:zinc ABC transporter substrate-binding protein [Sanguibacter sp. HDW7]QIK83496.1 zinc ABC transporter solute-binding protein [Sanguibacter sp. HDW7]